MSDRISYRDAVRFELDEANPDVARRTLVPRRPLRPEDRASAVKALEAEDRRRARVAAAARHEEVDAQETFPEVWAAAHALGMRPGEIVSVRNRAEGLVVELVSGGAKVLVPEGRPDADGKIGWMLLEANPIHPSFSRVPTPEPVDVEVLVVEPEADPWAHLVEADGLTVPLVSLMGALTAERDAELARETWEPNVVRPIDAQIEAIELVLFKQERRIRAQWFLDNPVPLPESEVKTMTLVYVAAALFMDAGTNRERNAIRDRILTPATYFLVNPILGWEHEMDTARGYLEGHGLPLPAVPRLDDLVDMADPEPLTLDELVALGES